jgi:hypothetical protein
MSNPGLFRSFYTALLVLLLAGMVSCVPERQIANRYVKELHNSTFLLLAPDNLYKANLSASPVDDSSAMGQTKFIGGLSAALLQHEYTLAFGSTLRAYGFTVKDSILPYPASDSLGRTLVLDIAQLGVEEYLFEYRDQEEWDTSIIYKDFVLRGMSLNLWLDISGMDGARDGFLTLFHSFEKSDRVEGDFRMNMMSGEVSYKYTLFEMQEALALGLAAEAGRHHATMLVDYLINEQIRKEMPAGRILPVLNVSLDPATGMIRFVNPVDTFIVMP